MKRRFVVLFAITFIGLIVICWYVANYYFRPVTPKDIRELSSHLVSLFDEPSLARIVWKAAHRVENPRLKFTLLKIYKRFDDPNCKPFHELLLDYPDVFPPEFSIAFGYSVRLRRADIFLKEVAKSWPDDPKDRWRVLTPILKSLAIQALKDEDWFYRKNAVSILVELDGKNAISHILPLLHDPEPRVREVTRKALQKLGYKVGE